MSAKNTDYIHDILRAVSVPPEGFERTYLMPQPLPESLFRIHSFALDISGRCNLACRYCAESATQPNKRMPMSSNTLLDIWSFVRKQGKGTVSFRLGSGEPMLNKPRLHELQDLIENTFSETDRFRPEVFITTNGTLFDNDDIDWFADSGWHVKISIDGPPQIHDRWRVTPDKYGTYNMVSTHVRDLARRIPEKFSVTAVLTVDSDPETVFNTLASLGVRRIELVPAVHKTLDIVPNRQDILRYQSFIENLVDRLIACESGHPQLVRFSNRVARVMGYDINYVQCGAGRNFFGIDSSGNLYPCFRFIGVDSYKMGNVRNGVAHTSGKSFRNGPGRPWNERSACKQCWAAPLCGGPCFAVSEIFGSGNGAPLPLQCAITLIESHGAWRLVDTLRKNDPERLLAYLPSTIQGYEKTLSADKTT